MGNRLASEKSIYLQQHKDNPVAWHPWGAEAFDKAVRENKPLLVSIGYSTCHWCHVMEEESFEDPEVARLLNDGFVAIKVDREEHPEVDRFFMDALHAMNPRGGWPLNMFATPDRKPFFGGTYFPRDTFRELLGKVAEAWRSSPEVLRDQAERVLEHVASGSALERQVSPSGLEDLAQKRRAWVKGVGDRLLREFDPVWGGFGSAPKFPRAHGLSALLRSDNPTAREAALTTLRRIGYGGIRDHLGGGFHRYSTDERWLVPHFEKMLYDQALLVEAFAEAQVLTGDAFYANVLATTLTYLEREMRLASGAFAAAQDADTEGQEGLFFVWTQAEIESVLKGSDPVEIARFLQTYTVEREGNWIRHPSHGTHVPTGPVNVLALRPDADPANESRFADFRRKLFDQRALRAKPLTDTKALVSWNGWMATALLRASAMVQDAELSRGLRESGLKTTEFLFSKLNFGAETPLAHVFYGEEASGRANLEDWASLGAALQAAASFAARDDFWAHSRRLIEYVRKNFRDAQGRLRPLETRDDQGLALTRLEEGDNATPAALSTWSGVLLRQALADSSPTLANEAAALVAPTEVVLEKYPVVWTSLLCETGALEGFCLKVPTAGREAALRELAARKFFAGDVVVARSEDEHYQRCDFEACRERSLDLNEVLKGR